MKITLGILKSLRDSLTEKVGRRGTAKTDVHPRSRCIGHLVGVDIIRERFLIIYFSDEWVMFDPAKKLTALVGRQTSAGGYGIHEVCLGVSVDGKSLKEFLMEIAGVSDEDFPWGGFIGGRTLNPCAR